MRFDSDGGQPGWAAPAVNAQLAKAFADASESYFRTPVRYMGMGGTIPFLKMLGDRFPHAQFMVTGVLGPHSNAHGPNEFLDIETGQARHRVRGARAGAVRGRNLRVCWKTPLARLRVC